MILWGTPPLVSKFLVGSGTFPGYFFGFIRYLTAFFVLFLLLILSKRVRMLPEILIRKKGPLLICAFWLILMAVGQNFSIYFILGTSSSILLNFNPTLIYLAAPIITDEVYSRKRSLGVLIATIGLLFVLMVSFESTRSLSPEAFLLGNGLGFLSGVAWAGYSLSLRRFFVEWKEQDIAITAINLGLASTLLFGISVISEPWPPLQSFTILSIWGIIVVGIGAAAIAFTLYLGLIQRYGTITAGNIQFLVPLVSIFLGWLFLAEFSFFALIGGGLCAFGVLVVTYERPK